MKKKCCNAVPVYAILTSISTASPLWFTPDAHFLAVNFFMYAKPHLSFEKQVNLLAQRGLGIHDLATTQEALASINYYRFSGYAIPFMTNREEFKKGVTFENILLAMRLDERLRDLMAVALEWIELDFRTTFAHEHSKLYGAMREPCTSFFFRAIHPGMIHGAIFN